MKQFLDAFSPKKYQELSKGKAGTVILFVFLFVLVVSCFSLFGNVLKFNLRLHRLFDVNSMHQFVDTYIPVFRFENGTLNIEEPVVVKGMSCYFQFDDATQTFDQALITTVLTENDYKFVVLGARENVLFYMSDFSFPISVSYRDFNINNFDRVAFFERAKHFMTNIIIIYFVLSYFVNVTVYFFTALLCSFIALIVQSYLNKKIAFQRLYFISLYAMVPAFLLVKCMKFVLFGILDFPAKCVALVIIIFLLKLGISEMKEEILPQKH